jgi:hypothetical protein
VDVTDNSRLLVQKLALESCRNVQIGNPLAKGISGGQSKRTNIGIALVTNPRVLFLDEPTSGLDSYTANEVRDPDFCMWGLSAKPKPKSGGAARCCLPPFLSKPRCGPHVLPDHCRNVLDGGHNSQCLAAFEP